MLFARLYDVENSAVTQACFFHFFATLVECL